MPCLVILSTSVAPEGLQYLMINLYLLLQDSTLFEAWCVYCKMAKTSLCAGALGST